MIQIAREAVRSPDLAIDFGTASVRVTADSRHVREGRSVYRGVRAMLPIASTLGLWGA